MANLAFSISRYPLLYFCLLTFAIAFPCFAIYGIGAPPSAQFLLLILGSSAPAIAAFVISSFNHDRTALRQSIIRWRVSPTWYVLSMLLPTGTWLSSVVVASFLVAPASFEPVTFLLFPLVLATNFLEEIGWRGFALPRLLSRFSALTASLILALAWAFFHAPLYWQRPLEGLLFLAPIIPISVILTWFFQGTDGSVPVCAFFHAVFNTWSLSLLSGEIIQPLLISQTIFLIVLAIFLVSRYGPSLSRRLAKPAAGSSVT